MNKFHLLGIFCACLALDTPVTKASDDEFEGFFGEMEPDKPVKKYVTSSDDEDQDPINTEQETCELSDSTSDRSTLSRSLDIQKKTVYKPVWNASLQAYTYMPGSHGHVNPLLQELDEDDADLQSESVRLSTSVPSQAFLSGSYPKKMMSHLSARGSQQAASVTPSSLNSPSPILGFTPSSAIKIEGRRPSDSCDAFTLDDLQLSQEQMKSNRLRSWSKTSTDGPSQSPARHKDSPSSSLKEPSSALLSTSQPSDSDRVPLQGPFVFDAQGRDHDCVPSHGRKTNS